MNLIDPEAPGALPDPTVCYRALKARDRRFDGRFFTAVKTTGIYCRPVCPARIPKRENCLFVASAAAAEADGYRSCLRCRPEAAPGSPAWTGVQASVTRALRLIDQGVLDTQNVDDLATRLGIGARHLRRLFVAHVGASPQAVAATRRLALAKQLITDTDLPMSEVAFSAGYQSLRRFNDAVRSAYKVSPSELRRQKAKNKRPSTDCSQAAVDLTLRLGYRPPFAWDALIGYLAARAIPGVEQVVDGRYRRSFCLNGAQGLLEVENDGEAHRLLVRVLSNDQVKIGMLTARLRRLFDLDADPEVIGAQLRHDPEMKKRVAKLPGLRIPGAFDGFELCVRAILGQQVSVKGATTLAGRLVERVGRPLDPGLMPDGSPWPGLVFPNAEILAATPLDGLGMPGGRIKCIQQFAQAVARGDVRLEVKQSLEDSIAELTRLPGIGPWSAHYMALRALGEPDAFPSGDMGLQKAAGGSTRLTAKALEAKAAAWQPWRGYGALYLWNDPRAGVPEKAAKRRPTGKRKTMAALRLAAE